MKALILILLLTATAMGQQRNSRIDSVVPAPGTPGTVTISLREYDQLVERASRKDKLPEAAPLPFVLSHAVFKLRVEDQTLVGYVDIDGSLLERGAVKTPLTSNLTILEAKQAGQPLPILQEGSNHSAILSGPGPFAVSLGVAAPLTIEAGRASFVLQVPLASSTMLSLELPGNHANVHVEPGLITKRDTVNGNTVIEAALEPGKPARIWWTTREIAAPVAQREVRFLSDVKTVVSVDDSELRLTALCDVTVIQGETGEFKLPVPDGYDVTATTGNSVESSDVSGGILTIRVHDPARRNHQFLIALERANRDTKVEAPMLEFPGAQRETGELLVEAASAMELKAKESGGLRRIDVREANAMTRSLSRFPLQAAFRYNRKANDAPKLELEWQQFQDADVLSAVAERATVTTLANVEGRTLTEIALRVRNHAKAFMKVDLPAGAKLFTAEIEGERVKPAEDQDGTRIPLTRPGLDTSKAYNVSFVYLNEGPRFAKNGSYDMGLPKLDIPINVLTWEVALPERLEVKQFGGNAVAAELLPAAAANNFLADAGDDVDSTARNWTENDLSTLGPGQIGGIVVDPNGAVVAGAQVAVVNTQTGETSTAWSGGDGHWVVSNMQPGPVKVHIMAPGFQASQQDFELFASKPARMGTTLQVGSVNATVTIDGVNQSDENRRLEEVAKRTQQAQLNNLSQNVFQLQRRVAGLLPVAVDVPRSGKSYRFVRPLVLEEETRITFQYKAR